MPLLPLDIPAGFYRNGTDIEQSGRWRDGSLVRWLDGSLRPVGGWSVRKNGFSANPVRGMHSWQSNNGTAWLAGGTANELIVMTGAGVRYDITPDDLASGRVDASVLTGYGYNFYGTGIYGQPRPVTTDSIPEESTIWVLDNFGEQLIALCSTDGRLLVWDLTTTVGSELVTNGDFVTDSDWTKGTNWSINVAQFAKYAQYKPTFNADDITIVDPSTDTITITGHDFADGDEVTYNVPASPASALNGLTDGTNYFIVNATANNFKLAATSGGSAIDIQPNTDLIFDADDPAVKDTVNNKIVATNIFTSGDYVTYENGGGTDITNLSNNSNYFIVNATSSEFQVSLTSGGAPIDLGVDPTTTIDPNNTVIGPLNYAVTVVNVAGANIFALDGAEKPTLQLVRGQTYTFDVSDASNATHPIGFFDGGTAYTTGVTVNGTEGQAGATVTFAVPANAPANLTYQCVTHGAAMGNAITTIDNAQTIDFTTETITSTAHGLSDGNEIKYSSGTGTDINGLVNATDYFVVSSTTDTFKLAATSGGAAINLTAPKAVTVNGSDATVVDLANDKIVTANTFVNGEEVSYFNGNGTDITGLTNLTNFFIVNATGTEFQLSATSGGAAITLTALGAGTNHSFTQVIGTTHTFDLDIGSTHKFRVDVGDNHQLERINFGNLDQTITGLQPNSETVTVDGNNGAQVNYSSNRIVASNVFQNNTKVTYSNGGGVNINGLIDGAAYFLRNLSSSEFQLSTTPTGGFIDFISPNQVLVDGTDAGVVDATNDKIIIVNTFSNGEIVTYSNGGGGATDIAGLTDGTDYYIINATSTEFQLSATNGGAAIDITGVGTGTSHTFTQNIGSSHTFTHTFGDDQDSYDFEITLVDPDADSNTTTRPVASVKVVGTTSTTEFINETLYIGRNEFRFGSDDTTAKIEIIPSVYNTPDFYVDNITLKKKTVAEPIQNAPINNKAHVVTEERFLFALGAGGNSRKVQWCDFENLTQWAPATTNQSGSTELATAGQIMQGVRTRAGTLIITDTDVHLGTYIGPPYIYSFSRIATECGAVSRSSAVDTDIGTFWYGQENFFYFDGNTVQVLPCDVHDYVFGDFNPSQQSKIWGYVNGQNSEVWWYYCSSEATEIDRYVAYNYREKHWLIGNMSRTSGVPRGVFAYPFLSGQETETITLNVTVANDSGNKYYISSYTGSAPSVELIKGNTYIFDQSSSTNTGHPLRFSVQPDGTHNGGAEWVDGVTVVGTPGTSGAYTQIVVGDHFPTLYFYCSVHSGMGSDASILEKVKIYNHEVGVNYSGATQFAETGPISLGSGDSVMKVNSIIPDEKTQGDVQMTFKTRFHPNDTERSFGPIDPTNPTSLRFTGRQIRMRVTGEQATDWRVGVMRLNTTSGGRR